MPTKPIGAFTHATDALLSSGPASGFPTKNPVGDPDQGFIPGLGISSQQVNTLFNLCGLWLDSWVLQGTSANDADAHIVETNSGGLLSAQLASIGTATLGSLGLNVENMSNIFEALNVENHDPDGAGAFITAGGTGLTLTAGDSALRATAGPGSPAASFFKTVGGKVRGAIHIEPQSDPSTITEGDFWITPSLPGIGEAGRTHFMWSDQTDGGTQTIKAWGTNKGNFFRDAQQLVEDNTNLAGLQNRLTLSADPKSGGKYKVTFTCAVKVDEGIANKTVGVKFDTGIIGREAEYKLHFVDPDIWTPVTVSWMIDGSGSAIVCTIGYFSPDGSTQVAIKDCEIIFEGSYDETN